MSYSNILSGIKTRLLTVTTLKQVLLYMPASIDETPMAYVFLDSAEVTHASQPVIPVYQVTVRVVVRWQDNEQAEAQIAPFVDSVVDAIRGDPLLGGKEQIAMVTAIEGAFITVGGVEYRAMDFTVRVKEVRT